MTKIYRKIKGLFLWTKHCIQAWISGLKYVTNTDVKAVRWSCYQTFFTGDIQETKIGLEKYDAGEKILIESLK